MEDLNEWVEKINDDGSLIIVEGIKDKKALEEIGVKNKIMMLSKKPIFSVIEDASANKKAVILTDLDKEGKKLYGILKDGLSRHGVVVDNKFREFLFRETKIRQIEGLTL
ncbi:MAG: toprim domain-containing protein [Candidatus Woesearchaeota archaeon]|nr:toprim domain-containing protein [Candidatus Woesearchaeota archaeon]